MTYPHVLGFPLTMRLMMSTRDFPLPLLGLVHTSIGITRHRATPSAASYDLTVHVDGLAPHRRGTEAAVVTRLRAGDDLVWESRSTYLARHRTAHTEKRGRTEEDPGLPAVEEWQLPGDLGRRYGAASGDRNPIHLHPLTARLFGFPRAIAHGMWTVARCLAAHGVPDAAEVRADFRAPVLLPGTVTYAADGGRFALRGGPRPGSPHRRGDLALRLRDVRVPALGGRGPVPPGHQVAEPRPREVHQRGRRLPSGDTGGGVGPVRERLRRPDQRLRQPGHLRLPQIRVAVRLPRGGQDQLRHERDDLRTHRGHLGGEHLTVGTRLEVQHRPAVWVPGGVREERGETRPQLPVRRQPGPGPPRTASVSALASCGCTR